MSSSALALNHRTGFGAKLLSSLVGRARTQSPDRNLPSFKVTKHANEASAERGAIHARGYVHTAASGPVVAWARSSASGPTLAIGVPSTSMVKDAVRVSMVALRASLRDKIGKRTASMEKLGEEGLFLGRS